MNILIDCGANIGQGFEKLSKMLNIDSAWDVYMFEPNPNCIPFLRAKYKHEIINKAVSTNEKKKQLTLEFCEVEKNWTGGASHIIGKEYIKPNYIKKRNLKSGGFAECIDLSTFIKDHFANMDRPGWSVNDKLYLKLDIEGMEFPVLDKMCNDGTLAFIDSIFVEWHERFFDNGHSRIRYIEYFKENNINYSEWI